MNTSKENYKETLAKLKKALGANRFLRWWLGELSGLVPAWMRSADLSVDSFMLVPLAAVNAQLSQAENNDPREVALTLPDSLILRKTLTLPLATEENLQQVLEFQVEQHTPFSPSQVYFGYAVTSRDFERGQLIVEFVATPREGVDAAIKTLRSVGASAQAVFPEGLLADGRLVNLLPTAEDKTSSRVWSGANPWLAALLGVLVLAAIAAPIVIKREAVVQLLPWVDKGKKAAEIVDALRHELEARVDQHNFVLERRQKTPTVIQTLEELTRVLPDDTWVQTLDLKGKELLIQGETASSVRLIGLFEQSSIFRDASFRSPLTKGQGANTERYQLALQVRPIEAPTMAPVAAQQAASSPTPAVSSPTPVVSTPQPTAQPGPPSVGVAPTTSASVPSAPVGGRKP